MASSQPPLHWKRKRLSFPRRLRGVRARRAGAREGSSGGSCAPSRHTSTPIPQTDPHQVIRGRSRTGHAWKTCKVN
eukprot:5560014-Pyramimonas_sp.AAC.1